MMELKIVKLTTLFLVIAISQNGIESVAIDTENGLNKITVETSKSVQDDNIVERINALESEVAELRQENKKLFAILNKLIIDKNAAKTDVHLPEEPTENVSIEKNQQSPPEIDEEPVNVIAEEAEAEIVPQEVTSLIRSRRSAVVGGVAFSAYLTSNSVNMAPGQAIKFDQVLLNDGQGYNAYTGAFTAPVTGTYLFTFHFDTHKLAFVRIVLNGVNQIDAVANPHTNAQSDRQAQSMGGNTAILHVLKGQAVLVESYEVRNVEINSSNTFRLSTFSGVLLY